MIPRPPSATRTYPLCPYPTLFRSLVDFDAVGLLRALERDLRVANLVGDIALGRSLDRAAQRAVDADLQVADAKGVVETAADAPRHFADVGLAAGDARIDGILVAAAARQLVAAAQARLQPQRAGADQLGGASRRGGGG